MALRGTGPLSVTNASRRAFLASTMMARIRVSYAYERCHTRMALLVGGPRVAVAGVLGRGDMPYAEGHEAYAYGQKGKFWNMFLCTFQLWRCILRRSGFRTD